MKKMNFMIVAASLLATTAITSCKKEIKTLPTNQKGSNSISTAKTAQQEEDYYDDMIRTVSYGIADLSTNPVFRQTVADMVVLQFDGDDNVLLDDLDSALATQGINLQEEMTNSLTVQGKQSLLPLVQQAVEGFQYFEDTLYTQIYVPFITGKNIVSTTPTICLNFEDEPVLTSIKKEGSIITTGTVNEATATTDNVYVISVNESVNNQKKRNNGGGSGSTLKTTAGGDRILQIIEINISDKKEGWGNGRADISFASICFRPSCNRQDLKSGTPFGKIANAEIGSWFSPSFGNKAIANGLPDYWEQSQNEDVKIVFYELDVRKKLKKTINLFPACSGGAVDVISKEDVYGDIQPLFGDYPLYTYSDHEYILTGGRFKLRGTKF